MGNGDAPLSCEVLAGNRAIYSGSWPKVHDLSAMIPSPRAQIKHKIALADNLRIVFNYDNGVLDVPESLHDIDEPIIIPWVEANAGFIQDIEAVNEGGAKG